MKRPELSKFQFRNGEYDYEGYSIELNDYIDDREHLIYSILQGYRPKEKFMNKFFDDLLTKGVAKGPVVEEQPESKHIDRMISLSKIMEGCTERMKNETAKSILSGSRKYVPAGIIKEEDKGKPVKSNLSKYRILADFFCSHVMFFKHDKFVFVGKKVREEDGEVVYMIFDKSGQFLTPLHQKEFPSDYLELIEE